MTPTQILHTVYLCIIAGIVILGGAAMIWWHHDAVVEGEAKIEASTHEAVEKQQLADAQASQDVIDGLNQDKLRLQAQIDAKPAPPPLHVCGRVYWVDRPLPQGTSTTRAAAGEPANPSLDSGVPAGGGSGDVGPGVRAIAEAGELLALYYQRLNEWAVKTQ